MEYWVGNCSDSNILVITDKKQYEEIKEVLKNLNSKSIRYLLVDEEEFSTDEYNQLNSSDLLIVALSIDSFVFKGYNKYFSPFNKPQNLLGYKKVILNATDLGRKLYESYGFTDVKGEMKYKFK